MNSRPLLSTILLLAFATSLPAQERRGPGRQLPPGVKAIRDIEYVENGGKSRSLDLFLPENAGASPLPLVVWIHGGAWRSGSKEGNRARPLLQDGFAVASINYRLTDEAIFPAQIQDCKAAIRFLRANAAKYGIDPDRIGVWGGSAGGHLVALLGVAGDRTEWDVGAHLDVSSRVQAVLDWFGPTDLLTMGEHSKQKTRGRRSSIDHDAPDSPESKLIGGAVQEHPEKARAASPMTYVSKDDAPILIVHGDKDSLVPVEQSWEFNSALVKAGVDSEIYVVVGGGHGDRLFNEPEIAEAGLAFFKKHLQPEK